MKKLIFKKNIYVVFFNGVSVNLLIMGKVSLWIKGKVVAKFQDYFEFVLIFFEVAA